VRKILYATKPAFGGAGEEARPWGSLLGRSDASPESGGKRAVPKR
jgi:hypothetical protein